MRGRLVKTVFDTEVYYEYDAVGNTLAMTTGVTNGNLSAGARTSYRYNHKGQLVETTNATGLKEICAYDTTGLLLSKTDYAGTLSTFVYDGLGRVIQTKVRDSSGAELTHHTLYTRVGQIKQLTNNTLTTSHKYDYLGRLTEEADSDGTTKRYEYDISGNRSRFELVRGGTHLFTLTYGYDDFNRLTQVARDGAGLCSYSYDVNSNCTEKAFANGLATSYAYDTGNRVHTLTHKKHVVVLEHLVHTYTGNGLLANIRRTKQGGTPALQKQYQYDAYGRLRKEENYIDQRNHSVSEYDYDQFGNRVEKRQMYKIEGSTGGFDVTEYSYNILSQLLAEKTVYGGLTRNPLLRNTTEARVYQYDANGNQTYMECSLEQDKNLYAKPRVGFSKLKEELDCVEVREYNGSNQLISVFKDDETTSYAYKPNGLRYSKRSDKNTKNMKTMVVHLWDGQNMVADLNANGSVRARYLRGLGLIGMTQDYNTLYYLHNSHGDVTCLTNDTGETLHAYEYDAFGVEVNPNPQDYNPFRYCGEYYDRETKTVYLRARSYNPVLGRFTSEDSVRNTTYKMLNGQEVVNTLSLNLYAYCYNSPILYHDPTGNSGELTLAWSASMWWLCLADGPIPVGDVIYVAGIGVMAVTDAINMFGAENVVRLIVEVPEAINQTAQWAADKIQAGADGVNNWFNDTFGSSGTSPGDPNWNGGFKSFRQLKKFLGSAGEGNQWHHIVEQSQIDKSGFAKDSVHNVNNVVKISKEVHQQITGYYNSIPMDGLTNGLRVRDWLAGQDFQTQYEFGIKTLQKFGVST